MKSTAIRVFAAGFLTACGSIQSVAAAAGQCDNSNPQLLPPYASAPAIPWKSPALPGYTKWSTNGVIINLETKIGGTKALNSSPLIQGVNYEPTQIGGSPDYSPYNDFFFTNGVKPKGTWAPLWTRDVELMRSMGVNAIRTYGWWKWEPANYSGVPMDPHWSQLNFSATDESNTGCFGSFPHPTHNPFLDKLWNNGVNPIYVWIGIALPPAIFSAASDSDLVQFYRYTTRWVAQKYGNHPAVMGFVFGNERDNKPLAQQSHFWQLLNDFGDIAKKSAPDKLTMSVFHDTTDPYQTITDQPLSGYTGPQAYKLDVWSVNPYTNPALQDGAIDKFQSGVYNCKPKNAGDPPCVKPFLFGEWGTPADTHMALSSKLYPLTWGEANWVFKNPQPSLSCQSQAASPPGSGGDQAAEIASRTTIAVELPINPSNGGQAYTLPSQLAHYFTDSGFKVGAPLKGGDQGDYIAQFWAQGVVAHQAGSNKDRPYVSGGFVFEWRDEWGKSSGPTFQNISGTTIATACPPNGDPGAANNVFPGGWGDEEWFGLSAAIPKNRQVTDPVVDNNTGELVGGPDILKPRAAITALCIAYKGCPLKLGH